MRQPCTSMSENCITSEGRKASARNHSRLYMSDANSDMRNNKSQADCVWRQGSLDPKKDVGDRTGKSRHNSVRLRAILH